MGFHESFNEVIDARAYFTVAFLQVFHETVSKHHATALLKILLIFIWSHLPPANRFLDQASN